MHGHVGVARRRVHAALLRVGMGRGRRGLLLRLGVGGDVWGRLALLGLAGRGRYCGGVVAETHCGVLLQMNIILVLLLKR